MTTRITCLFMASLLAAGCSIRFGTPEFPEDAGAADTAAGDAVMDAAGPDTAGPDTAGPDTTGPDATGPDVLEPDLLLPSCAELNGECASPRDPVERNEYGCPWGYESDPAGTCPGDAVCCVVSPHCTQAGDGFDVSEGGAGCCPGLQSRDRCDVAGFEACGCDGGSYVCTDCGDGACDEWENPCICAEDCPWKGEKCVQNGGECAWDCMGGGILPFDCDGEMLCCALGLECVGEGEIAEDVPGSPPCCEELEPIPLTQWYGGDGGMECEADDKFYVCTVCGDNQCQEWESPCTCPEDCPYVPMNVCVEEGGQCMNLCPQGGAPMDLPGCEGEQTCCSPDVVACVPGNSSFTCPPGEFCKGPPYACGVDLPIGICKPKSETCVLPGDPVCGCDGLTYQGECLADAAQEPIAYFGPCGDDCVGLGGWGTTTDGSTAACCGDLDAVVFGYPASEGEFEECIYPVGEYVCIKCGDGICGPGEDVCTCHPDCWDMGSEEPGGGG